MLIITFSMPAPGALAKSGEESVEWILQHDAIVEGMIVDRNYIEPRRSLLDWAIVNDQPYGPRGRGEEPFRGCRLGVRVTDALMGEGPDILEIDLWWVDESECVSASGDYGEGLDIGSTQLFLIYQDEGGRWVPDSLRVPFGNQWMIDWVREVVRPASGDRSRRTFPQPRRLETLGQPSSARQHFSPDDTPARPPSADHKQVDVDAN